jgi:hypothetical protein
MEAMVTKFDRDERGVGNQNFRYAPAWDEMCHILKIHSPRAYRSLSVHFPMRSEQSFRWEQKCNLGFGCSTEIISIQNERSSGTSLSYGDL